ncbi:MAG: asparagine synthase (glutamine-hydrolyzing) [Gemmatimonadetes bacterium]|nr:asparagine synthase (glutamine-hydrolyzing) [Gemmatimonadota bacterium]
MCGIAGVLTASRRGWSGPSECREARERVTRMARAIRHRGPDDIGTWIDESGRVALGHTRLRVVDLDGGAQPMEAEGCVLVFNGEIYNHGSLRGQLEDRGHAFRSRSDTEVVLRSYLEWGQGAVDRFEGMFAFGLWDSERQALVLARDRAGQKPLFYGMGHGRLWFASEIKALVAGGLSPRLSPQRLPQYLTYGYVPTPYTFYDNVRHLPPGTVAVTGLGRDGGFQRPVERRYWQLRFHGEDLSRQEVLEGVRSRFVTAVERRLEADVPLGAFLSGGLDSTLVVAVAARLLDRPLETFSIGFADDAAYDETDFARLASGACGSRHTEFKIRDEPISLVDELVRLHDQPFGDSSAVPTYIVSRLTRDRVTVALSGDGGDELFAGYLRLFWGAQAESMPRWMLAGARSAIGMLPPSGGPRGLRARAERFLRAADLPMDRRVLRWIGFFTEGLNELVRPQIRSGLSEDELLHPFRVPLARAAGGTALDRILQLNFETYLVDDLLTKVDRCSMAHGLEVRSPFLDSALMSFAARIPDRYRAPRGRLKWALRHAFKDLLPDPILKRGKMGFGIPLDRWFREGWRPALEAGLMGTDSPLWDWLEPDPVRRLVQGHLSGRVDHGHRLWALLTLDRWMRQSAVTQRVETHV